MFRSRSHAHSYTRTRTHTHTHAYARTYTRAYSYNRHNMEQITDVYVYIRSLSSLLGGSSMLLLPAKREQDNGQSDEANTAEGYGSLSEDVPRQSWEGWPLSEHPDQRNKSHITIADSHT